MKKTVVSLSFFVDTEDTEDTLLIHRNGREARFYTPGPSIDRLIRAIKRQKFVVEPTMLGWFAYQKPKKDKRPC